MPIAIAFSDLKDLLEVSLRLSRDALHVHVGLVLFVVFAALNRSPGRFRAALLWLLTVCLLGEAFDIANAVSGGDPVRWLSSAKDIVNTMAWPTLLVFAGPRIAQALGLSVQGLAGRPAP